MYFFHAKNFFTYFFYDDRRVIPRLQSTFSAFHALSIPRSGYLQRIESGKVKQPSCFTLERILQAIEADSRETDEVLALFGYTSAQSLPTEQEMDWARNCCHDILQAARLPTYLLDCAQSTSAISSLGKTFYAG